MAKGKFFSLDHMAVGCVVIAGVVEAAQQALTSAPKVSSVLPSFINSPNLNYVPLGLITLAGVLWVVNQFRDATPELAVMRSANISESKGRSTQPVAVGPSLPLVVSATKQTEPQKPWRSLTSSELLAFIRFVQPRAGRPLESEAVKFLATKDGRPLAELFAQTLIVLGYEVLVNRDDATYIFPAKDDQQTGIMIRFPYGKLLGMAFTVDGALSQANLSSRREEFPKGAPFINFVQVEIGNWTMGCQWT
jgi:hypothetical protein